MLLCHKSSSQYNHKFVIIPDDTAGARERAGFIRCQIRVIIKYLRNRRSAIYLHRNHYYVCHDSDTKVSLDLRKVRRILITLIFFLLAGLCEIGGGYLVWLWLREDMSWILGAIGGFILFL